MILCEELAMERTEQTADCNSQEFDGVFIKVEPDTSEVTDEITDDEFDASNFANVVIGEENTPSDSTCQIENKGNKGSNRKKTRKEQVETMLDFINQHPSIISNKFKELDGKPNQKKMLEELADLLKSNGMKWQKEFKGKRSRVKNYTEEEEDLLLDLVIQHKDVLENKRTDAGMWKEKEACWEEVARAFSGEGYQRTAVQLRSKFDSLKKTVRAKKARQEALKSGDGVDGAKPLTKAECRVLQMILSAEGLTTEYDSDMICDGASSNLFEEVPSPAGVTNVEPDIAEAGETWSAWISTTLRSTASPATKRPRDGDTHTAAVENENVEAVVAPSVDSPLGVGGMQEATPLPKRLKPGKKQQKCTRHDLLAIKVSTAKVELQIKELELKEKLRGIERNEELHQVQLRLLQEEGRRKEQKHQFEMKLMK